MNGHEGATRDGHRASGVRRVRRLAGGTGLAVLAAAAALAPAALSAGLIPRAITGGVKHIRGNSGQLDAVVDPNGVETSYYFEYGPTVAYGTATKPVLLGRGTQGIPVGQSVTGLLPGYHYRVVATYPGPKGPIPVFGRDKSFKGGKSSKLRFDIPRGKENEITVAYGGTAELSGGLTGQGNTSHGLVLQADPFPYSAPFTNLIGPVLSNLSGHFLFRVPKLTQNTEFRILTVDTRPIYSAVQTVHVTPKIVLRVRRGAGKSLYNLYGTVAPARLRGTLVVQELRPQKANSTREGPRAHTIGTTPIKQGSSSLARFSKVLTLSGTSRYRVYIRIAKGPLESGHSNNVLVRAPKRAPKTHGKRARKTHGKHTTKHTTKKKK